MNSKAKNSPFSGAHRVVGLIPAAGRATRLAPLPCSKELLPVGFQADAEGAVRPKVVSQYLIEQMRGGGADHVYIVLRSGKWDIADYYGDGSRLGLQIAYLVTGENYGPPFTLSQAAPFVGDAIVLFGFPDILLQPDNAFPHALERLHASGADVVLGLFPAKLDDAVDLTETDPGGRVTRVECKEDNPARTDRHLAWMLAVWRPSFTAFLTDEVRRLEVIARATERTALRGGRRPEWPVGAAIQAAVAAGLHVDSAIYENGRFLDIGTSAGLLAAHAFPGVWTGSDAKGQP